MDDALLVGVLDRMTDLDEQRESVLGAKTVLVAVVCNGDSLNQFHHEVRPTGLSGPGINNFGDIGVIHQGQDLAFCFKSGNHLLGVHAQFDDL